MKIIHTASGKAYHLAPGTQLEIERPNLFLMNTANSLCLLTCRTQTLIGN